MCGSKEKIRRCPTMLKRRASRYELAPDEYYRSSRWLSFDSTTIPTIFYLYHDHDFKKRRVSRQPTLEHQVLSRPSRWAHAEMPDGRQSIDADFQSTTASPLRRAAEARSLPRESHAKMTLPPRRESRRRRRSSLSRRYCLFESRTRCHEARHQSPVTAIGHAGHTMLRVMLFAVRLGWLYCRHLSFLSCAQHIIFAYFKAAAYG